MKGNNTLTINQATMKEAIQFWLEQKIFSSDPNFQVEQVELDLREEMFVVKLSSPVGD